MEIPQENTMEIAENRILRSGSSPPRAEESLVFTNDLDYGVLLFATAALSSQLVWNQLSRSIRS
jgi:hypothetical protein